MTDSVSLSVCGDVERPACLALAELRALMDAELVADFHCREGWTIARAAVRMSAGRTSVYGRLRTRLSPDPGCGRLAQAAIAEAALRPARAVPARRRSA